MIHCFDVDNAVRYGLDEAIFIENVRLWLNSNQAAKRNFHNGKYWTYNTAEAYAVLFPYWNAMKVHRITKSLEDQGVLEIGHFNSNSYNRTKWYTFTDHFANLQIHDCKNAKSSNTYIKPDTVVQEDSSLFDSFWKAYPRKINKGFAKKVFAKMKVTEDLLAKMIQAIEVQKRSVWKDKDPQYIPHPSTWLNGERWEDEVQTTTDSKSAYGSLLNGI